MSERSSKARLLVLLSAAWMMIPMGTDLYLPGLPELSDDLGVTSAQTQLTITAFLVGVAVGQLVAGPWSDSLGRRRPLLIGIAAYAVATAACAVVADVWVLVGLRVVQGLAGAAGIAVGRAMVRDRFEGVAMVRVFALLMSVVMLAPILAPVVGGALLTFTDWRGLFVFLAAIVAVLGAFALLAAPETHPPERRRRGGLATVIADLGGLLGDRVFMGYALGVGLTMATLFAYIGGSSFVFQDHYGLSELEFALVFSLNGAGVATFAALGSRLAHRYPQRRLLATGLAQLLLGVAVTLFGALADVGLAPLIVGPVLAIGAIGLITPNASALALEEQAERAGSASALLGLLQFGIGALFAPLPGLLGGDSGVSMAVLMVVGAVAATTAVASLTRGQPGVAVAEGSAA